MKKIHPIFGVTVIVIIIAGLGFSVLSFLNGRQQSQEIVPPAQEQVIISGEIGCLPKRTSGAQTLECALGLKADDGNHYALINLSEHDPNYELTQVDTKVEVKGTLNQEEMIGPDGNPYDIIGTIAIDSIQKL